MKRRRLRRHSLVHRLLLAISLTGSLALSASAANWCNNPAPPPTPTPLPRRTPPCEPKECEKCRRSPCYVGSGAYTTDAQDLAIRTSGFPLTVARSYESGQAVDGPLGIGWSSSAISRLYYAVYLFAAPSTYRNEADLVMADGARYTFTENGDGTYAAPQGRHDLLVRNPNGTFDLTLQRSGSTLHFALNGSLGSMADDHGNALNLTYDTNGHVQQVADASGSGRYLNIFWGPDGRISAVQDSSGRQVQYVYNGQGALATVTDAAGRTTNYSYTQGRFAPLLSRITDNWGRVLTDVTYDSADRVRTYTEKGETYTYTYSYQGNPAVTAKADSQGNTYVYPFGSAGLVVDSTPPLGGEGTTHTDYYPDGAIQQVIDPVGVKTFYTYTSDGSPLTVTRDYEGPTAVRYDYAYDVNFPTKVIAITPKNPATNQVDPNWQAWRYDYYQAGSQAPGALNHVYRVHDDGVALDTMTTYEYDSQGRIMRSIGPTGGVTDYAYDVAGNLATLTAPANNDSGVRPVTFYAYDALGRITAVTDALGHTTSYTYDALDRVTAVMLPKPSSGSPLNFVTTYSYDSYDSASGLILASVTDPNLNVTKQWYDQFGQLVKTTDAVGNSTSYGYTRGRLTSLTDANNNVTNYAYDSGGRLTSTVFPDGAVERCAYTADGLLYQKTDRKNQTITYVYDRLKRLIQKTYPNSTSITYTYQGQKLIQVVDTSVSPSETHTSSYDASFRIASNTQATRGTISYLYNADDTVLSYSVQSGPAASYIYYPDGSLNTIAWTPVSGDFKYSYTASGQYQSISFPNGQRRNYDYDDQGRLTRLANLDPAGGNIATYAYGYDFNYSTGVYDRLGQRVSMTATVPSQGFSNHVTTYEYDSLYQLTKATYPNVPPFNGEVASWAYDAIGNRLTNTVNGATQTYSYQKTASNPLNWQRLLADGVNTYTYDANGNTTAATGFTFGLDFENRLVSIAGSTTASYRYDYQGRRTAAGTTNYFYDGMNPLHEQDLGGADYLYGAGVDEPLAMLRGSQIYYYATDALGSAAAVTDSAGGPQLAYVYDAWGQTRSHTGAPLNPFVYTARERSDGNLLFYRARYLSPSLGRFLQEDPLDLSTGQGLYPYVRNNPLTFIDPYGLKIQQCFRPLAGAGVVITVAGAMMFFPFLLQPPVPGSSLCPMHEYLYNTDTGDSWGYDPRNIRREDGRGRCSDIPEPLGSCVWRNAPRLNPDQSKYNLLTNNCQTAINRTVDYCRGCEGKATPGRAAGR